MLSITTKTQYGLLALLDLAEHFGKDIVQINDIVARNSVPKNYLEQILNRLTKTGLVKSVRGKNGGYELGKHPDGITLLEVIETIEGAIILKNNRFCKALDEVLEQVEVLVTGELRITLSELLQRQKFLDQQIMYSI